MNTNKGLMIDPTINCDYIGKLVYVINDLHNVEWLARAISKRSTTIRSIRG